MEWIPMAECNERIPMGLGATCNNSGGLTQTGIRSVLIVVGWGGGFRSSPTTFLGGGVGGVDFRPLAGGVPPPIVPRINRRLGLPIGLSLGSP